MIFFFSFCLPPSGKSEANSITKLSSYISYINIQLEKNVDLKNWIYKNFFLEINRSQTDYSWDLNLPMLSVPSIAKVLSTTFQNFKLFGISVF
jgi:hypothetical protein